MNMLKKSFLVLLFTVPLLLVARTDWPDGLGPDNQPQEAVSPYFSAVNILLDKIERALEIDANVNAARYDLMIAQMRLTDFKGDQNQRYYPETENRFNTVKAQVDGFPSPRRPQTLRLS
jgi:hypothetical protein